MLGIGKKIHLKDVKRLGRKIGKGTRIGMKLTGHALKKVAPVLATIGVSAGQPELVALAGSMMAGGKVLKKTSKSLEKSRK